MQLQLLFTGKNIYAPLITRLNWFEGTNFKIYTSTCRYEMHKRNLMLCSVNKYCYDIELSRIIF